MSVSATNIQTRPKSMTIHDMYLISTKQDTNFGIEGYECNKTYIDARKQMKDKEYAEYRKKNKWPKNQLKALQPKTHLDDILFQKKGIPGPQKYKVDYEWVSKKDIERGKSRPKDTTKNTYIDEIIKEQKLRSVPGVGKYNLRKTDAQEKEELTKLRQRIKKAGTDRILDVDTVMWQSNQVPGPGQYNPRKEVKKIKENQMKPEDWIKKHGGSKKRSKSSAPDPGTYKAQPLDFDTFDKIAARGKVKNQVSYMGKEIRFPDPKKTKSMTSKITIGPGHYDMRAKWIGKEEGNKGNKKASANWHNRISRGISKSIYYS